MDICRKCDNQGNILLRKKDFYCENCFLANINHKFRSCIGKNKILTANENVLICLSGGLGSTALVDFIHHGVSLDNNKKLRITPHFLHIMEGNRDDFSIAKAISEQCDHYKFTAEIAHISEYIVINDDNKSGNSSQDVKDQFEALIKSLPISSQNDFLLKVKHDIFIHYGKKLQCRYIFTAESSETLAIKLLSNLSNGRGSQVQHDIGFCDSREEVKILRPIKDISLEELQQYIKLKQLAPQCEDKTEKQNSIQGVIKHFVMDLQENFHSTISTVCKTADKIGIHDANRFIHKCKLCKSGIGEQERSLSALDATNYSRAISSGHETHMTNRSEENLSFSMFPHVNKSLCYTCSRQFTEMDHSQLPLYARNMLDNYSS